MLVMNPTQFEYSQEYLLHLAFNCFTSKYFETMTPLINEDYSGRKDLQLELKLLSVCRGHTYDGNNQKVFASKREQALYTNHLFSHKLLPKKAAMSIDPSRISLWTEYFCRYDEGKKENTGYQI